MESKLQIIKIFITNVNLHRKFPSFIFYNSRENYFSAKIRLRDILNYKKKTILLE